VLSRIVHRVLTGEVELRFRNVGEATGIGDGCHIGEVQRLCPVFDESFRPTRHAVRPVHWAAVISLLWILDWIEREVAVNGYCEGSDRSSSDTDYRFSEVSRQESGDRVSHTDCTKPNLSASWLHRGRPLLRLRRRRSFGRSTCAFESRRRMLFAIRRGSHSFASDPAFLLAQ
jgi:hypothetical protein